VVNDVRRRTLTALALVAGLLLVSSPGYAASSSHHTASRSAAQSCEQPSRTLVSDAATGSVKATKAELASIESAIAAEQLCVTDLSEEYDNATYRLGQLDAEITATRAEIEQASQNTTRRCSSSEPTP